MSGLILGRLPQPDFTGAACTALHEVWDARGKHADETRRQICHACRQLPECFAWALSVDDRGFWAGTTASQRQQVRARYGITAQPMAAS